jgi:hypothetical protein
VFRLKVLVRFCELRNKNSKNRRFPFAQPTFPHLATVSRWGKAGSIDRGGRKGGGEELAGKYLEKCHIRRNRIKTIFNFHFFVFDCFRTFEKEIWNCSHSELLESNYFTCEPSSKNR